MPRIKEVDDYIKKAPEFARPILEKIRELYHEACPEIEEAIKWSQPAFMKNGIVGGMGAFKKHVSIGFWRAAEIEGIEKVLDMKRESTMGARKIESLKDMPNVRSFKSIIKKAVKLNDADAATLASGGKKVAKKKRRPVKRPEVPEELAKAFKRSKKARDFYEQLAPSHQREYVEWITEAKREETRTKRLATTLEWLAEGKKRNWKYESC